MFKSTSQDALHPPVGQKDTSAVLLHADVQRVLRVPWRQAGEVHRCFKVEFGVAG